MVKSFIQDFKIIILALTLFLLPTALHGQVINPGGPMRNVSAGDIMPRTLQGSGYNEFWNYHFYLNDGMSVHITFSVVDFGAFKSPVSGIRISIFNLYGETYQVSREYPIERLYLDRQRMRFQLHPERDFYFEGRLPDEHRIRVYNTKADVLYDIDLQLTDIQKGISWGDGIYTVGNDKIGIFTHIPYAKVSGHIAVNDKKKRVSGTAYMDHTWQHQSNVKIIDSGYKFISHAGPESWDIINFLLPASGKDSQTIGHRISRRNDRIGHYGVNRINNVRSERIQGKLVAKEFDLVLSNGSVLKIERTRHDEMHDTFGELGWIARMAVRRILGGELIDFRGGGLMRDGGQAVRGNYNFVIID